MKQLIAAVFASAFAVTGFSQLPDKDQIKKLGIKKIEANHGKKITEGHYDKQGYEIKFIASGKVIRESKIYYNKLQKPDSIVTTHSYSGVEKKFYKYSATGAYYIISLPPNLNRRDTVFFDKNHRELRETWSTGLNILYKYNSKNQLSQITETKPNGDVYYTSFTYDQKGRKINSRRISGTNKIETEFTYTYNTVGQLEKESQTNEKGELFIVTNYQYSEKGLPILTTGKFMTIDTRTSYDYYFY